MTWEMVDEGWGRKAVDFATLSEPGNCREYVFMHHRLGVSSGLSLLDVACGSGLSLELAHGRGATCAGLDASHRLIDIARDRNPHADIRVGDMNNLPWEDATFDVVTSFRGIWGTTPKAMDEMNRVLRPGGRLAMTVWGNVGKSPGAWMFEPFRWATDEKVQNQADMVSLGRPGVGEAFMADHRFAPEERFVVPFFMEYSDPSAFARGLAATGPAYEAIQSMGLEQFISAATNLAEGHVRDGLPLRGEVELFGYIGTKP